MTALMITVFYGIYFIVKYSVLFGLFNFGLGLGLLNLASTSASRLWPRPRPRPRPQGSGFGLDLRLKCLASASALASSIWSRLTSLGGSGIVMIRVCVFVCPSVRMITDERVDGCRQTW